MKIMTIAILIVLGIVFPLAAAPQEFVQHAPLVGSAGVWQTETRLWNPNATSVNVTITDVIGTGAPTRTVFTIPANGTLDLPFWAFFCEAFSGCRTLGPILAAVEFTSDQPIRIYTEVTINTSQDGPRPDPPPAPTYWGGSVWDALAGTLLQGKSDYFAPGMSVGLAWLTASLDEYRDNLYFVNPDPQSLTITATFIDETGATQATKIYTVAAHSNAFFSDVFADPALAGFVGPVTVRLVGDQRLDVAASIIAIEDVCDIAGHFAFIQGESLP